MILEVCFCLVLCVFFLVLILFAINCHRFDGWTIVMDVANTPVLNTMTKYLDYLENKIKKKKCV